MQLKHKPRLPLPLFSHRQRDIDFITTHGIFGRDKRKVPNFDHQKVLFTLQNTQCEWNQSSHTPFPLIPYYFFELIYHFSKASIFFHTIYQSAAHFSSQVRIKKNLVVLRTNLQHISTQWQISQSSKSKSVPQIFSKPFIDILNQVS